LVISTLVGTPCLRIDKLATRSGIDFAMQARISLVLPGRELQKSPCI